MVLAKEETVVKEWEYGKTKSGWFGAETKCSLTVTNKRVIAASTSSRKTSRDEIALKDIQGISVSQETPSQSAAIALIIIGVILMSCIIGIPLFIIGIKMLLNQGSISLSIVTRGVHSTALSLGLVKRFKLFSKKVTKMKVNNQVAQDMAETIGALVIANE